MLVLCQKLQVLEPPMHRDVNFLRYMKHLLTYLLTYSTSWLRWFVRSWEADRASVISVQDAASVAAFGESPSIIIIIISSSSCTASLLRADVVLVVSCLMINEQTEINARPTARRSNLPPPFSLPPLPIDRGGRRRGEASRSPRGVLEDLRLLTACMSGSAFRRVRPASPSLYLPADGQSAMSSVTDAMRRYIPRLSRYASPRAKQSHVPSTWRLNDRFLSRSLRFTFIYSSLFTIYGRERNKLTYIYKQIDKTHRK